MSIKYKVLSIKYFAILFLLLNTCYILPTTAIAADSTPSADIKLKLEELKKEIASKAANLKQELNHKLQNKAYVGNIKTHSQASISLASNNGPKLVTINQDTVFDSQVKGKQYSLKNMSDEDYIAALGDIDETQVLIARKITLLPKPKTAEKTYLWGKIVSIDGKLANLLDNSQKNISISNSSDVSLKLGDLIIATGKKSENDIFDAGFVSVISRGAIIKPKKVATPSAQTSAKSASPSASPKK